MLLKEGYTLYLRTYVWAHLAAFSITHIEYLKENIIPWQLQVKALSSFSRMMGKDF